MTWGPRKSPKEVWPGGASPPGEGVCRGTPWGSCGLGPLGGPYVTKNVLEKVGELAVAVWDVGSALRQGPQDVREGRQAPVYERSLPQGRSCHSRHTWESAKTQPRG